MIVCLNPRSCGGKGAHRWAVAEALLLKRRITGTVIATENHHQLLERVREAFKCGEHYFVAAGGDGSVNALLNSIMNIVPEANRNEIVLGAIGLGSSNDFHKPYSPTSMVGEFPSRIDFASASPRDVGVLSFKENGITMTRYFLVNASVGLTATANYFFNVPDLLLHALKRTSTGSAIAYASVRTILSFRNIVVTLQRDRRTKEEVNLTNLNILKSPHVSGSLTYPVHPEYDGGLFNCFLARKMGVSDRLRLLASLMHGRIPSSSKLEHWTCSGLAIFSSIPFAVEFDGEIATTAEVRFSVLPHHLQVCQC